MHITASVFINGDERGLHADYEDWLEELAPHDPISRHRHNRTAHMYVIGLSGKGKSKLLEYCLYQDIAAGRGGTRAFCFKKPLNWTLWRGMARHRRIVPQYSELYRQFRLDFTK